MLLTIIAHAFADDAVVSDAAAKMPAMMPLLPAFAMMTHVACPLIISIADAIFHAAATILRFMITMPPTPCHVRQTYCYATLRCCLMLITRFFRHSCFDSAASFAAARRHFFFCSPIRAATITYEDTHYYFSA